MMGEDVVKTNKSCLYLVDVPPQVKDIIPLCVKEVENELIKNPKIIIFGKECIQHRDIGFYSDESEGYRYSGQLAKSKPLTENLCNLLKLTNELFNSNFNGILINRYNNGNDYIGAHSDDERFLDDIGVVALSLFSSRSEEKRVKNVFLELKIKKRAKNMMY